LLLMCSYISKSPVSNSSYFLSLAMVFLTCCADRQNDSLLCKN
jgi:hypothetical protein